MDKIYEFTCWGCGHVWERGMDDGAIMWGIACPKCEDTDVDHREKNEDDQTAE